VFSVLAISTNFVAGKYHGTPWDRHANEGVVEWPPSPWRLLRALVSTWKVKCPDLDEEATVSLLSKLAVPPAYCVPPTVGAHTRHYMPWEKNWKSKREGATTLVFDSFLSVDPSTPLVALWEEVELAPGEMSVLETLLSSLTYLGRAESWCSARVVDAEPPAPNCQPLDLEAAPGNVTYPLLLLAPELPLQLETLFTETGAMRRKGFVRPRNTRWVRYLLETPAAPDPAVRTRTTTRKVHAAYYELSGPVLPLVTKTLRLADLARAAIQSRYGLAADGGSSTLFSGKGDDGTPLEGNRHTHYIPLDCDGDRRIDHLVVYASDPVGFSELEQETLGSLRHLKGKNDPYDIEVALLHMGDEDSCRAPVFEKSTVWESVTPFLLVRHPKLRGKAGEKKLVDGPADQVRLELERRGFPKPASVEPLSFRSVGGRRVRWLEFDRWRRGRRPPVSIPFGFRLEFDEPVRGPLALGSFCHYGMGLFLPP
jgi:CRISPR-associated protein Csb2